MGEEAAAAATATITTTAAAAAPLRAAVTALIATLAPASVLRLLALTVSATSALALSTNYYFLRSSLLPPHLQLSKLKLLLVGLPVCRIFTTAPVASLHYRGAYSGASPHRGEPLGLGVRVSTVQSDPLLATVSLSAW
jgi:hypothetical protein